MRGRSELESEDAVMEIFVVLMVLNLVVLVLAQSAS